MVLAAAVVVAITAALLLLASHFVAHDWRFLSVCAPEASVGSSYRVHDGSSCAWQAVYVWPNRFVDLTPNVGLWWYLFTEVFDRFRPYVIVPGRFCVQRSAVADVWRCQVFPDDVHHPSVDLRCPADHEILVRHRVAGLSMISVAWHRLSSLCTSVCPQAAATSVDRHARRGWPAVVAVPCVWRRGLCLMPRCRPHRGCHTSVTSRRVSFVNSESDRCCRVFVLLCCAGMKLKPLFLFTACLASTLLPVMWHLWVVTGAGNANFFYNQVRAPCVGCCCQGVGANVHAVALRNRLSCTTCVGVSCCWVSCRLPAFATKV